MTADPRRYIQTVGVAPNTATIAIGQTLSNIVEFGGLSLSAIIIPQQFPVQVPILFRGRNPGTDDFLPIRSQDGRRVFITCIQASILAVEKYNFSWANEIMLELEEPLLVEHDFKFILSTEG